jgi:diguanylate cyclase (GGDEF)-like protein
LFPRSFRARLTSFFIIIVILPMVAVSVMLFRLVADAERGKNDARLGQAQTSASGLFQDAERRAAAAGRELGGSPALAAAIRSGDGALIQRRLAEQARAAGATRAELRLAGGGTHTTGDGEAIAPATTTLVDQQGEPAGTLKVAVETAAGYARLVRDVTTLETVVVGGDRTVASTLGGADGAKLPMRGDAAVGDRTYRLATFKVPGWDDAQPLTIRLLDDESRTRTVIKKDQLAVGALLFAFLVLACAFAFTLSRSLQAQVQRLLEAAKRVGAGDFSVQVPTEGQDEFAALGSEFNAMAVQLERRLFELENERARLQNAIRRVGESITSGLDPDALLEIVVETAVDGVAASVGRASVRDERGAPLSERAHVGEMDGFGPVLDAVERAALERHRAAEVHHGEHYALSYPLPATDGDSADVQGLITVARGVRPFSGAEQDLFHYLAGQAAQQMETAALHETVQRQAVTDELTGLFNHRRFQEVMTSEVERAKRFQQPLGLIMLDLDDFKLINDRYGHLQGDEVLREVARVLLDSSREIDEPARYGGEEMAVALPQTDLEGAYLFAERLRERIGALDIPIVTGEGTLRVTASLGAAALPLSAEVDKDALVAAADAALYEAKRLGKNRVVRAG